MSDDRDCLLYARISDAYRQGDGYSIAAQISEGSKYAERHGFEVTRVFIEKESAKEEGRPVFNEVLDYVKKAKKPVVLLVEKTDRLYRNSLDKYLIETLLKKKNLEVHLFKEGEILKKDMSAHKKQVHGFKAFMAEIYIENLREEALKGTREKLQSGGWPSRAPYGYKNANREVVIDESRAPFVREAFMLYATGLYSLNSLCDKMYEDGLVYRPYQPRINRASLAAMLKNPFYIGEIAYQGEIYPGKHPPLIAKQTWLAVQEALRQDGKPVKYGKHDFRFKGVLTCAECGSAIVGEVKKGKYVYYRCAANTRGCKQGYVREEVLESQFNEMISAIRIAPERKAEIMAAFEAVGEFASSTLAGEIREVEIKLQAAQKRRRKAYQDYLEGLIDEEFYRQVNSDIQMEIRALQARFEKLSESDLPYCELAKKLLELPELLARKWIAANDVQKRKILKSVCSNFILDGENIRYELEEPLSLLTKSALDEKWWAILESNQ
jgi:site-specific DNA recombinase